MIISSSVVSRLRPTALWRHATRTSGKAAVSALGDRQFHFASNEYTKAFRNLPKPDVEAIRNSSKDYLQSFDPQLWYDDPVSQNREEFRFRGFISNLIYVISLVR